MPKSRKPAESKSKPRTAQPRAKVKAKELSPPGKFPFDREMATFRAHLPELLAREGAYVVIRGEEIAGICDDLEEAANLGYERYGLSGFMLREITAVEPKLMFAKPYIWPS
ncbi:MAG: hypothetical protein JWN86_915 [Planctomycetota bacterium]|nr:hypothetical protein [Planctomycetota bacterium]